MKKIKPMLFIALMVFFSCCNQSISFEKTKKTNELINQYYAINYDYPHSLDELLLIKDHNLFAQNTLGDENNTLSYLENNARRITWMLYDSLFPKQELIVLFKEDTIVHRFNEWRFPCIGYYNDAFVDTYLKEPVSLDEFLSFCNHCDSMGHGEDWEFGKCEKVTVSNLQKLKEVFLLQWIIDEDGLFIVIDKDTIWQHHPSIPCDGLSFQPHFYGRNDCYYDSEELERSFMLGIRELGKKFMEREKGTYSEVRIVEYDKAKGMSPFCGADKIDLTSKWFKEVERYLENFAKENDLGRIVFAAPVIREKHFTKIG